MKIISSLILIFVIFSYSNTFCQKKDSLELVRPYFFVSANFEGNISGKVMPSSGLEVGFGINLARFFTKKIVLGLYYESSMSSEFSTNNKYHYLTNDIGEHIVLDQTDPNDHVRAYFINNAYTKNQFNRCYKQNYGIAFSPFPDRYGEIILFLTKGSTKYFFSGENDNPNFSFPTYSNHIEVPTEIKATLMFKPFTLTKMKDKNLIKDHFHLGFYIQQTKFQSASLADKRISNFLDPAFFVGNRKYEIQIGFRIGIGVGFLKNIRI
jgi:hypothetical protein